MGKQTLTVRIQNQQKGLLVFRLLYVISVVNTEIVLISF